jgi:hypothetical protein
MRHWFGLYVTACLVLVVLKVFGLLTSPWLAVLAPVWLPFAIVFGVIGALLVVVAALILLCMLLDQVF